MEYFNCFSASLSIHVMGPPPRFTPDLGQRWVLSGRVRLSVAEVRLSALQCHRRTTATEGVAVPAAATSRTETTRTPPTGGSERERSARALGTGGRAWRVAKKRVKGGEGFLCGLGGWVAR